MRRCGDCEEIRRRWRSNHAMMLPESTILDGHGRERSHAPSVSGSGRWSRTVACRDRRRGARGNRGGRGVDVAAVAVELELA